MAKLNFKQRRELTTILEMVVDEDLLSDAISDLIAERDNALAAQKNLESAHTKPSCMVICAKLVTAHANSFRSDKFWEVKPSKERKYEN